jgi:hypothetical protein
MEGFVKTMEMLSHVLVVLGIKERYAMKWVNDDSFFPVVNHNQ